jgi:hypothetical protein
VCLLSFCYEGTEKKCEYNTQVKGTDMPLILAPYLLPISSVSLSTCSLARCSSDIARLSCSTQVPALCSGEDGFVAGADGSSALLSGEAGAAVSADVACREAAVGVAGAGAGAGAGDEEGESEPESIEGLRRKGEGIRLVTLLNDRERERVSPRGGGWSTPDDGTSLPRLNEKLLAEDEEEEEAKAEVEEEEAPEPLRRQEEEAPRTLQENDSWMRPPKSKS